MDKNQLSATSLRDVLSTGSSEEKSVSTSPVHPFEFTPMQRQDELPVPVSEPRDGPVQNPTGRDVSHRPQVETVREEHEDSENEDLPPNLNGYF